MYYQIHPNQVRSYGRLGGQGCRENGNSHKNRNGTEMGIVVILWEFPRGNPVGIQWEFPYGNPMGILLEF